MIDKRRSSGDERLTRESGEKSLRRKELGKVSDSGVLMSETSNCLEARPMSPRGKPKKRQQRYFSISEDKMLIEEYKSYTEGKKMLKEVIESLATKLGRSYFSVCRRMERVTKFDSQQIALMDQHIENFSSIVDKRKMIVYRDNAKVYVCGMEGSKLSSNEKRCFKKVMDDTRKNRDLGENEDDDDDSSQCQSQESEIEKVEISSIKSTDEVEIVEQTSGKRIDKRVKTSEKKPKSQTSLLRSASPYMRSTINGKRKKRVTKDEIDLIYFSQANQFSSGRQNSDDSKITQESDTHIRNLRLNSAGKLVFTKITKNSTTNTLESSESATKDESGREAENAKGHENITSNVKNTSQPETHREIVTFCIGAHEPDDPKHAATKQPSSKLAKNSPIKRSKDSLLELSPYEPYFKPLKKICVGDSKLSCGKTARKQFVRHMDVEDYTETTKKEDSVAIEAAVLNKRKTEDAQSKFRAK